MLAPREIAQVLTGIDRFNPDHLPKLEAYVDQQVVNGDYDKEANLTILKLYQLSPGLYRPEVVTKVLLKAITQLPLTDLVLCKHLLDYRHMESEPLRTVVELGDLLERCNFREFWIELHDNCEETIEGFKGFEDSIRVYISYIVSLTYQRVSRDLLKSFMGIANDTEFQQWIERNNWKDLGDGFIFINPHDQLLKTKNEKENITLDDLARIADVFRPKPVGY